jgi:hypothetical protein
VQGIGEGECQDADKGAAIGEFPEFVGGEVGPDPLVPPA